MKIQFIVLAVVSVLSTQMSFAQSWKPGPASTREARKVLEAVQKNPSNLTAQALAKTLDLGSDLGMTISDSNQSVEAERLDQPQYYELTVHMIPTRGESVKRSEGFVIQAEVYLTSRGAYVFNSRTERLLVVTPHPGVGLGNR